MQLKFPHMRLISKRQFPHPVLGIKNDVSGSLDVKLSGSADNEFVYLEPKFNITGNNDIKQLIESEKAHFVCQVNCKGTLFRTSFTTKKYLNNKFQIPANQLNGKIEIDFLICTTDRLPGYRNSNFHEDYAGYTFSLAKGEILAYGGRAEYFPKKSYEQLKSVSSIMMIVRDKKESGPFKVDFGNERIVISLCGEDYERYQLISSHPNHEAAIHSGLVLPVLIEAINLIDSAEGDEFRDHQWYQILKAVVEKEYAGYSIMTAQKILDNPLSRAFLGLEYLIEQ